MYFFITKHYGRFLQRIIAIKNIKDNNLNVMTKKFEKNCNKKFRNIQSKPLVTVNLRSKALLTNDLQSNLGNYIN